MILENSIYSTPEEREEILKDKAKVAKLFLTTFMGIMALYGTNHSKTVLTSYLRSDKRVRLGNITDENNDFSLVVKLAEEAKVIRTNTAKNITRLLYLVNRIKIDSVDEEALRDLVTSSESLGRNLKGRFKREYLKYASGEQNLYQLVYRLRRLIRSDEDLSEEFRNIFVLYLPLLKSKAGIKDDEDEDEDEDENVITIDDDGKKLKAVQSPDGEVTVIPPVKDDKVAVQSPEYDLTNPDTVQKAFLEMIKSPDARRYVKEIGTTLGKFPFAMVKSSPEIAHAWYLNRSRTSLAESYVQRIRPPVQFGNDNIFRSSLKKTNIPELLYVRGMFEELKKGMDKYEYILEIIKRHSETPDIFAGGLKSTLDYSADIIGTDGYKIILRLIREGHAEGGLSEYAFEGIVNKRGTEISKWYVDNFESLSEEDKETAFKFVLLYSTGNGFYSFNKSFLSIKEKYLRISASKELVLDTYGEGFPELYEKLEKNDFFGSDFLREFEINELKEIDPNASPSKMYDHYRGTSVQLVPESDLVKVLEHVLVKNLYVDFFESLPSFRNEISVISTNGENPLPSSVSSIYGVSLSGRTMELDEENLLYEIYIRYLMEKNKDSIFGRKLKTEQAMNVLRNVPNPYDFNHSNTTISVFNEYSTKNGKFIIEVGLHDDEPQNMFYTLFGINFGISPVRMLLPGVLYGVVPDSNLNVNDVADRILSDGLNGLLSPSSKLGFGDLSTYVKYEEEVDDVLGKGFVKKLVKTVLERSVNDDLELKDIEAYKNYDRVILDVLSRTDDSLNGTIKKFFDHLGKQGSDVPGFTPIPETPEMTAFQIKRGLLGKDALTSDKVIDLASDKFDEYFDYDERQEIIKTAMEEDPRFVAKAAMRMGWSTTTFQNLYTAITNYADEDQIQKLDNELSSNDSLFSFAEDDYVKVRSEFVRNFLNLGSENLKHKVSRKILDIVSTSSNKGVSSAMEDYDILVDCLFNVEEDFVEEVLENISSPTNKRRLGVTYITKQLLEENNIREDLFAPDELIKPMTELTDQRLLQVMEYNDIKLDIKGKRTRKGETFMDMLKRVKEESKDSVKMGRTKVESEEISELDLQRRTIEFNRLHNAGKHGDVALEFKKSFVASPELTKDIYEEFKAEHSDTVMFPVFHGTGSVAASMILRFGYSVIDASDSSAVGRMLGNGIYFSNKLDKAAQYVGDAGFSRRKGTRGYVFEMEAVLGKENVDYQSAGVSGSDGIISPEWCVFDPAAQLSIKKAHEVSIVSRRKIDELEETLNESRKDYRAKYVTPLKGFFEWIKPIQESFGVNNRDGRYSATFIFRDGTIPTIDGTVHWKEALKDMDSLTTNPDVKLSTSSMGVAVVIYYDDPDVELDDVYVVDKTQEFADEDSEVSRLFFSFLA